MMLFYNKQTISAGAKKLIIWLSIFDWCTSSHSSSLPINARVIGSGKCSLNNDNLCLSNKKASSVHFFRQLKNNLNGFSSFLWHFGNLIFIGTQKVCRCECVITRKDSHLFSFQKGISFHENLSCFKFYWMSVQVVLQRPRLCWVESKAAVGERRHFWVRSRAPVEDQEHCWARSRWPHCWTVRSGRADSRGCVSTVTGMDI